MNAEQRLAMIERCEKYQNGVRNMATMQTSCFLP